MPGRDPEDKDPGMPIWPLRGVVPPWASRPVYVDGGGGRGGGGGGGGGW